MSYNSGKKCAILTHVLYGFLHADADVSVIEPIKIAIKNDIFVSSTVDTSVCRATLCKPRVRIAFPPF